MTELIRSWKESEEAREITSWRADVGTGQNIETN